MKIFFYQKKDKEILNHFKYKLEIMQFIFVIKILTNSVFYLALLPVLQKLKINGMDLSLSEPIASFDTSLLVNGWIDIIVDGKSLVTVFLEAYMCIYTFWLAIHCLSQ